MSTKRYVTPQAHSVLFDILVAGTTIYGNRIEEGKLEFIVPEELTERFETHYHFKVGNIVEVSAPAEAEADPVKAPAKKKQPAE